MQFEKLWEFADATSMPNAAALTLGYIDLTSDYLMDWRNTGVDLWFVITCNTEPSAGTSLAGSVYVHTGVDVKDGTALMTGRAIPIANMSENAQDYGHVLFSCPVRAVMAMIKNSEFAGSSWDTIGPVVTAVGDCSSGIVDAYLRVGPPEVYCGKTPTVSNV